MSTGGMCGKIKYSTTTFQLVSTELVLLRYVLDHWVPILGYFLGTGVIAAILQADEADPDESDKFNIFDIFTIKMRITLTLTFRMGAGQM